MQMKNRREYVICAVLSAVLLFAGVFTVLRPIFTEAAMEIGDLTLTAAGEKRTDSFGSEVRILEILLNGDSIDLVPLAQTAGWHMDETMLAAYNVTEPVTITIPNVRVKSLSVTLAMQCGSGFLDVAVGDLWEQIDLYSVDWVNQKIDLKLLDETFTPLSRPDLLIILWGSIWAALLLLRYVWLKAKPVLEAANLVWLNRICICFFPILCAVITEVTSNVNIGNLTLKPFLLNCLIWGLIALVLSNLLYWKKIGFYLTAVLSLLAGVANHYVLQFRMYALMPSDLLAWRTGFQVMKDYQFDWSPSVAWGGWLFVLAAAIIFLCAPRYHGKKQAKKRLLFAVIGLIGLAIPTYAIDLRDASILELDGWNSSDTYSKYGFALSFMGYMQSMRIEKADGYTDQYAEELLDRYAVSSEIADAEKPTVIAIMNEAFGDLRVRGDLGTTDNVMWFWDSLDDCIEKGSTYVSVRGGKTSCSEFEFLTGNSMSSVFRDTIPFTMLDLNGIPNLAAQLKEQGYRTVAMHPEAAGNYKRSTVYPQMGFDVFYSYPDFTEYEKIFGNRISDIGNYRKLIEVVEEAEEPLFLFNVTMQNHGGYYLENLPQEETPAVQLDKMFASCDSAKMYLSLINESNRALQYLIEHFRTSEKKVIICFFGDHQPGPLDDLFEDTLDSAWSNKNELDALQSKQSTPYFIWANYETALPAISNENYMQTSPNFLAARLLSYAGCELTPYQRFLLDMSEKITAINCYGYRTIDGTWHSIEEELLPEQTWLNDYEILQYYIYESRVKR